MTIGTDRDILDVEALEAARAGYLRFIRACQHDDVDYRLTPNAEPTAYARCFAVFGLALLRRTDMLDSCRTELLTALRTDVRRARGESSQVPRDKPYRQLLAFTLSALAALDALAEDPLVDLVREQIPDDVASALAECQALQGAPRSGNQAMFLAIFLLHARQWMQRDTSDHIDQWVAEHLSHMNGNGFWGRSRRMTHLQFQNGYHQYEILEYLGIDSPRQSAVVDAVTALADRFGHFAPYPGGGGCYDYDAVFLLTPGGTIPDPRTDELLAKTARTLLSEQRQDGGFAESLKIRPRSAVNLLQQVRHVAAAFGNTPLLMERSRYNLALQRPYHDRIRTHWSTYSRNWFEADLWDSWFRMLTLARIQVAQDATRAADWGFIDYPGIGFHPSAALHKA